MRFSFSAVALFAAVAAVQVAAQDYDAARIEWNCPGLGNNAVIRLRPCYKNSQAIGVCNKDVCGANMTPATMSSVVLQAATDNNKPWTSWRVITTGIDPKTPQGHIRLRSEAAGFQSTFLAVVEKDADWGESKSGRETLVASYTNEASQALWQWKLRPNKRECRVLLQNLHAVKKLGLLPGGNAQSKINDNLKPLAVFGPDSADTNETWEVEVITPAPTGAAAAAASTSTKATSTSTSTSTTATSTSTANKDYATSTTAAAAAKPTDDELELDF